MRRTIFVLFLLLMSVSAFALDGTETMTRTAPSTVNAGGQFTLTYTAVGVSGGWGATIEDSVTGGCTFPSGGSNYATVMLSEDGNTKSITMNAPASGSCTFSGDYQYSDTVQTYQIEQFSGLTVTIEGSTDGCTEDWTCTSWSSCVDGIETRTCTDNNACGTTLNKPATERTCSPEPFCGDGTCDSDETATSCPDDCGANGGTTPDFCQYFDWAPALGSIDGCYVGVVIALVGVLVIVRIATGK